MSQLETDVELKSCRACCPVCHRRGRQVVVGFAVEGHGFFPLTRRPRQEERAFDDAIGMLIWQHYGASYVTDTTFRPPIRPGASTRMPEELTRTQGPVTCRYGHRLSVPGRAAIDRMLERIRGSDVVFLPAAGRARV